MSRFSYGCVAWLLARSGGRESAQSTASIQAWEVLCWWCHPRRDGLVRRGNGVASGLTDADVIFQSRALRLLHGNGGALLLQGRGAEAVRLRPAACDSAPLESAVSRTGTSRALEHTKPKATGRRRSTRSAHPDATPKRNATEAVQPFLPGIKPGHQSRLDDHGLRKLLSITLAA